MALTAPALDAKEKRPAMTVWERFWRRFRKR
jgi:hypothetical protein